MSKPYLVRAEWDAEAKVWVAMSDDVIGLITEAETIEALHTKLQTMVPELLAANASQLDSSRVVIELLARRSTVVLPTALDQGNYSQGC